jgi:hypothetical protein
VLVRLAVFPASSIQAIHSVGMFLPRDWMTDIGIIDRAVEYHAALLLLSLSVCLSLGSISVSSPSCQRFLFVNGCFIGIRHWARVTQ